MILALIFAPTEARLALFETDLGIVTGGHGRHAECLFQEIPKQPELKDGIAVNAGIRCASVGIGLLEGVNDVVTKHLRGIHVVVRNAQFMTHEGGIGPAASPFAAAAGDGNFHRHAHDIPPGPFQ